MQKQQEKTVFSFFLSVLRHYWWNLKCKEDNETNFNGPCMKKYEFVNPHNTLSVRNNYQAGKVHL